MAAACPSHGSKQRIKVAFDAKRTLNDGQSGPIVRQVERTFPPAPRRPLRFPTERAMDVVNVAWGVSPKRSRKRMSLCRHQAAVKT
jgi:hypothetical protein